MTSNKRLMMITCFFPPDGGAGVQRSLKFAKYLPEFNWDVTVVTREVVKKRARFEPEDSSLLSELTSQLNCSVERVEPDSKIKKLGQIDKFEPWAYAAGEKAVELLNGNSYDAIFITMSPFSLVRTAEYIRKFHNVPIILDFRDPWALDGWQPQKSYFHWLRHFRIMRKAILDADGVVANTVEAGKIFAKSFSGYQNKKHTVIENGYDAEDFSEVKESKSFAINKIEKNKIFTLVFTGTLMTHALGKSMKIKDLIKRTLRYSHEKIDETGRSLVHLIAAIKLLRKEDHPLGTQIRIECLGPETLADREFIKESGMSDIVTFRGYVPHEQSVQRIKMADALFLPLHNIEEGQRSRIVPGKTYEYLATGRPILGCLPEGDARDFIENCGVGVVVDPTSPIAIADALKKIVDIACDDQNKSYPRDWVAGFERKALTKQLSVFLDDICEESY